MTPSKHVPSAGPTGSSPTSNAQAILQQYAQVTATHKPFVGEDSQSELPAKRESYTRGQSERVQYLEYVNMMSNVTGSKQPTEKNKSENGEDEGDSQDGDGEPKGQDKDPRSKDDEDFQMAAMAKQQHKDLQLLPQAESSGMRQIERVNMVTAPSTRVVRAPSGEDQFERVNMVTTSVKWSAFHETFSGKESDNLRLFLLQFNTWCKMANVPAKEKGARLVLQLRGEALETIDDLPDSEVDDFGKIIEGLQRRFGQSETDYIAARTAIDKLEFRRFESFAKFMDQLSQLAKVAYPSKKGEARDERIFEDAMRLLPPDFNEAMMRQRVKTLADLMVQGPWEEAIRSKYGRPTYPRHDQAQEAIKAIGDYQKFQDEEEINAMAGPVQRASQNVGPQCYNCGEPGHIARYCRRFQQDQTGFNPSEYDHRKTSIMCYQCQGLGHYAYECPSAKYESSMYQTVCQLCGYQGHSANECAQWTGMFQSMAGLAIQGQGYRQMEVPQQVNTVQAQGTGISTKAVTWHDRQGALQEQNEVPRKKKCHICRRRTHEMKDCWMNPNSENFRPEMSEHSRFRHWQR